MQSVQLYVVHGSIRHSYLALLVNYDNVQQPQMYSTTGRTAWLQMPCTLHQLDC